MVTQDRGPRRPGVHHWSECFEQRLRRVCRAAPKDVVSCEDDEVGILGQDHPFEEGCGVEIGAPGGLGLQDVSASRDHPISKMHVGDLQDLEGAIVSESEGEVGRNLEPRGGGGGEGERRTEEEEREEEEREEEREKGEDEG